MKFALATAAAVVMSATASQAADLAKKAPAAVDYVKVCDTYGAGFFYIPGTDTCLKIGGYTRLVVKANDSDHTRSQNSFQTTARFRLNADARSNTELGVLRAFGQVNFNVKSGALGDTSTAWSNGADVDKAYLQLGGLTAGYAGSKFDFFGGFAYADNYGSFDHDTTTNLLAYTFGIGNGVSATVSLEDGTKSRVGSYYGGNKSPDLVANVNVSQAWGSAQVMGALHQDYGATSGVDSGWGYAVGAGVIVNLPMLGAGDQVGVQFTYADGANAYNGNGGYDLLGNGDSGSSWSVVAGLSHTFTSSFSGAVDFSYTDYEGGNGQQDMNALAVAGSLTWSPVKNFSATAFVEYGKTEYATSPDVDGIHFGFELKRSF